VVMWRHGGAASVCCLHATATSCLRRLPSLASERRATCRRLPHTAPPLYHFGRRRRGGGRMGNL